MASQEGTNKDQMVDAGIDLREATATIADTLEREPQLAGVLEMFRKLNMQGLLIGPEMVTFFAPRSADALAGKSDEDLNAILRGHILGRAVTLDELRTTTGVKTMAGTSLRIERDGTGAKVNGVPIIRPDIPCTNGVLHIVERPLES